jgi:hypothetical protein
MTTLAAGLDEILYTISKMSLIVGCLTNEAHHLVHEQRELIDRAVPQNVFKLFNCTRTESHFLSVLLL